MALFSWEATTLPTAGRSAADARARRLLSRHGPTQLALARQPTPRSSTCGPPARARCLDVGCGSKKYPGSVGLDISADTDADVVHDLDVLP